MRFWKHLLCAGFGAAGVSSAHADPLATPAMSATLSSDSSPTSVEVSPLGKIYIGGAGSILALGQSNAVPGDHSGLGDISNAQLFIQKTDGLLQFYVQVGGYSLPSLGSAYSRFWDATKNSYGIVPVAYLKFAPNANFNIIAGKLPTLVGAEYTFTFQNNNIERGLLWNQEPAVSEGVQANYTKGPLAVSVSWNDGYYSGRYTSGSALVTWTINPQDSIAIDASGNFDHSTKSGFATPLVQNNGQIYNLMFTHTAGPLSITPYVQFTRTEADAAVGILHGVTSTGFAVLAKYSFTPKFSIAARGEYIGTTGNNLNGPNILYGPGSAAWSLTITPTYQFKILYIRPELSYTQATSVTPGDAFGALGVNRSQVRGLLEMGVLF